MGMRNIKVLAILMIGAILGTTGFQFYWLKQNYAREKKSLELKANAAFGETLLRLQASKLKLEDVDVRKSGGPSSVKIFMSEGHDSMKLKVLPAKEVISTVNIIRDKMLDSLTHVNKKGVVISMNKTMVDIHATDTHRIFRPIPPPDGGTDFVLNLLSGVDSLRDSIRLEEIDSALAIRFSRDKLDVPYTIIIADSSSQIEENGQLQVKVGFVRPVIYQLKLGNSFPWLLKQILQPILFSVFLLGLTILSFVLLYRNMLKQQRLAELKNEFISNITHELKTPIATVGVAIEALKNFNAMDDPRRTREYLDISGNELQRLSMLVDKVLRLSMFEKKEIDLRYEHLNLRELVQEVASSLKLQLEKQGAQLQIVQEGDVSLEADRLHLISVIFNLVDNALKYGGTEPVIRIQLTGTDTDVLMLVADNGIGIAPEYQEKIFEKFFRVPQGDTHNAKGYGLGLSYAAQVIRKHQGTIRVISTAGKGSSFLITLPKKQPV